MKKTESILQQQICEYLSIKGVFYFSVPNEHYNISHAQRMTLKKMGLLPGMPDLAILANGSIYFLEVKTESGRVSEQQKNIHNVLTSMGYIVEVVRSVEDVQRFVKIYLAG